MKIAPIATLMRPREDGLIGRKMTVRDCRSLVKDGLLEPGKFELIEGDIVFKVSQDRKHIIVVMRIIKALTAIFGDSVQTQAQIGIGELDEFNDPETDVAVLRGLLDDYEDREPDPATEVLLAVEIVNTSLRGDTTTKARIYARQGIREYWVVSIPTRELFVHRHPIDGEYQKVETYRRGDIVRPLAAPGDGVIVADLVR